MEIPNKPVYLTGYLPYQLVNVGFSEPSNRYGYALYRHLFGIKNLLRFAGSTYNYTIREINSHNKIPENRPNPKETCHFVPSL